MTKSTKDDLSRSKEKIQIHDDFHRFGVSPKPASGNDAIEEALATAEAVVSKTHAEIIQEIPPEGELSESLSLKQVIEKAEKRLEYLSDGSDLKEPGLSEMLDTLDIKAELGRPDEMTEPSYISEVQQDTEEMYETEYGEGLDKNEKNHLVRSDGDWNPMVDRDDVPDGQAPFDDEMEETTHIITPSRGVEKWHGRKVTEKQPRDAYFFEDRTGGDIYEDPLWQLLCSVYEENFTGVIVLNDGDTERKLFFEDGQALIATSSARKDRLVELLHREGRLSDKEYIEACTAVGSTRRRAGAILVERGLISRRQLFPLVQYHYETIILDSFSWKNGTWKAYHGERPGAERILLEVSTPTLVLEGIRSKAPIEDIDEILPGDAIPVATSDGLCKIGDTGLSSDEKEVYRAADGMVSFDALSLELEFPAVEIRRLFAGLMVLGLVQFEDLKDERRFEETIDESYPEEATGESLPEEPMDESLPEEVVIGKNMDEDGSDSERVRVENKIAQAEEGSYFDILEVSPNASEYDIEQAFGALAEQFDIERFTSPELADLRPQVELIRSMIDEAYEVLRKPELCEQYRRVVVEDRSR
jgi:hypothetical protein